MTKSEAKQLVNNLIHLGYIKLNHIESNKFIEEYINDPQRNITFSDEIEEVKEVLCLYCGSKALIHYDHDKHYECLNCRETFTLK